MKRRICRETGRNRIARLLLIGALVAGPFAGVISAQDTAADVPSILVSGRGEAFARPNEATVRLGVTAQMENAAAAQSEVNKLMAEVIKKIRALDIPEEQIRTVGLNLSPVYGSRRREFEHEETLIGYRAGNIVQVRLSKLDLIGPVIDQAVAAGANRVEGISFDVADNSELRNQALRNAIEQARDQARVMADAAGVKLGELLHMSEGGVRLVQPQLEMARFGAVGLAASTPVQPGQVRVDTSVTMRFKIKETD